jgi:outer membrane protein TolC
MFPQGRTLDIKKRQLEIEAEAHPYQRQDRQAKVTVTVSHLWLDAFRAKETIALIEENRSLFEQLTDIATSSYSSAMGGTRQHDIIRAQLELTRLNDRVTMLGQARDAYQEKLSEWFIGQSLEDGDFTIAGDMPNTLFARPDLSAADVIVDDEELYNTLDDHPLIQKIDASDAGVDLAKQKYKPSWGLNASYGRRGSNSFGADLPDNVTVGVTLSVPLFTANRQDKEYSAALSRREAIRTEKWQLLRQLKAGFETAHAQLMKLDERKDLYENRLLPQMSEQAEASLTAYTNDDGDFAEVVRARIAELNAKIDALNIDVDRQKTIIQMNYFFTASDAEDQMTGDL